MMKKMMAVVMAICQGWVAMAGAGDAVPPKTHPDSANWASLFNAELEEVHATGHGHGHKSGLQLLGRGQTVELNFGGHLLPMLCPHKFVVLRFRGSGLQP